MTIPRSRLKGSNFCAISMEAQRSPYASSADSPQMMVQRVAARPARPTFLKMKAEDSHIKKTHPLCGCSQGVSWVLVMRQGSGDAEMKFSRVSPLAVGLLQHMEDQLPHLRSAEGFAQAGYPDLLQKCPRFWTERISSEKNDA